MLSNVSQMSTAMMSAPSCASLTAWLRPCPRAAPVMNATRPSSLPILCISLLRNARGDDLLRRPAAAGLEILVGEDDRIKTDHQFIEARRRPGCPPGPGPG